MIKNLLSITFIALSIGLRLFLILTREPAGDEIYGLLLTKASFQDIWFATFADTNPPFYFLFLHLLNLVGVEMKILTFRLISLIFGLLAAVSIFYLAKLVFGQRTAKITFLLSLFLPSYLWASVFARYYSFLILLTTLSIIFFIRFAKNQQTKDLLILALSLILGIYTHYYFSLLFLSFTAYFFLVKRSSGLIKKWFRLTSLILLLHLPLIFYLFTLPKPSAPAFSNNLLKIPAIILINVTSFENLTYLFYHRSLFSYFLAIWGIVTISILFFLGLKSWRSNLKTLFILVIVLPPTVALFGSYFLSPLALGLNSLLIFSPPLIVLLARGLYLNFLKRGLLWLVFLSFIFVNLGIFFKSSVWPSPFNRPYKFVKEELRNNDLIVHANIYTFVSANYYLGKDKNVGIISTTYPKQVEKALDYKVFSVEEILKHQGRFWYFEPFFYNVSEAQKSKNQLDQRLKLRQQKRFEESNINVYLYEH